MSNWYSFGWWIGSISSMLALVLGFMLQPAHPILAISIAFLFGFVGRVGGLKLTKYVLHN